MADKKKMSVEEILAAARKADGGGSSAPEAEAPSAEASTPDESPAPAETAPEKPAASSKPIPKSGSDRPSVADMLAMARAEKQGGAAKPEKPDAKPDAKKTFAKPAVAKASPKPDAKAPAAAKQERGPLSTASILAAARKSDKAGPVSKAEVAKKAEPKPAAADKKKLQVPPMPVKPAYAQRPAPQPKPAQQATEEDRRTFLNIGWGGLVAVGALWTLAFARFMYPNVLREPPSRFKVGFPSDFAPGTVTTKFKAQFGVWIVNAEYNGEQQLVALKSVCTHLGCTPNWLEAEQKFKCPCHGSGFYEDGINFEGPAPRPLERYAIQVADDGQVEIDKSRIFQEEMGQWLETASYIPV